MMAFRAFCARLGWIERPGSDDGFATYDLGSSLLALLPLGLQSKEAAPGQVPPSQAWSGVTFGIMSMTKAVADAAFGRALGAGAASVARPAQRDWGGYSGYIVDPDGNRWQITRAHGARPKE